MIKSALIGAWVCAVTIAASHLGATWRSAKPPASPDAVAQSELTMLQVRPVNVPVIRDDRISGYIVCQLVLAADAERLKRVGIKPEVLVVDAAIKRIYANGELDLARFGKDSWAQFAGSLRQDVNARYGTEVIRDVLVQEFGFVSAEAARTGLARPPLAPAKTKPQPH